MNSFLISLILIALIGLAVFIAYKYSIWFMRHKTESKPPKTTMGNFTDMAHIHSLIFWFFENDQQVAAVNSPSMSALFDQGYRPSLLIENEFLNFTEAQQEQFQEQLKKFQTLGQWLAILAFLELATVQNKSLKFKLPIEEVLRSRLEKIGEYTDRTLIESRKKVSNNSVFEISKEKNITKKYYFEDIFYSAQLRLLAWIYRELFNKDFQFRREN